MSQSSPIPCLPSQENQSPVPIPSRQDEAPQSTEKRFKCPIPECRKLFNRKEHVTRHLKSHSPNAQYQCHICGRRYVRSDVLRRHVSGHTLPPKTPEYLAAIGSMVGQHPIPDGGKYGNHGIDMGGYQETDHAAIVDSSLWNGLLAQWPQESSEPWHPSLFPTEVRRSLPLAGPDVAYTAEWATGVTPPGDTENISGSAYENELLRTKISGLVQTEHRPSFAPESLAETMDSTLSDLQTHTSSNSSYGTEDEQSSLAEVDASSPETQRLVQVYFARVHSSWPILHPSTFEIDKASNCLLGSMVMLAAYHEGNETHKKLARTIFSAVTGQELMSSPSLHLMQALLLCVVYSLSQLREQGMAAKATHLNSLLISTCRSLGIFDDQHLYHSDVERSPLSMWLAKEQLHRLAFAVFCADTYMSIILDHPPTVRYQELQIPLPMSTRLWEAVGETERRRLQWQEPAGRQKGLFSSMLRDILEDESQNSIPYQLGLTGSHLGLCALRNGVWEAAREAHSSATDELSTKYEPGSPIQKWRENVARWQKMMEEDCSPRQNYFLSMSTDTSSSTHPSSALTLILGHLYYLHMHAPLNILQAATAYGDRIWTAAHRTRLSEDKGRLRTWMASSCSRIAVLNAAQISRVVEREFSPGSRRSDIVANPLAIPGLLTSAIVVCFVANRTLACSSCASDPSKDQTIDLFSATDKDEKLTSWKESGRGLGCWGPSGITVCHCKTQELALWFRGHLSKDVSAETEFLAFMDSLQIAPI
ncbi:hypothetical protein HD806DRAFT_315864 [Xylariaceae sp. AK1471]|nr:hypothetical protein HD806DRAFT_315864 [Xylariaceae sp. AK1471]